MVTFCVSDAFYKQLKNLRITDFPCGNGTWVWRQSSDKSDTTKYDSHGAQFENVEDLMELESSGPYAVDCSWSKETRSLRKIAIESPESLKDPNFILKHFTTLRIVDKNVSNIDDGILKFINLKELILSANFIDELDGRNFPKSLEVLELAANNIKDVSGLKGDNLSSLLHLGLAHNKVAFISSSSFTPARWPSLLSLDLSYNNLSDLQSTVEILKLLPVLRNLLLIGNPLYLSKCYHGFVIDSIPGLSFLDNAEVSADDRHHFKSLSRIKGLDVNSCHVVVEIAGISGVKKPVVPEESDSVADYPKIEFKYHVEFEFLKDFTREEALEETRGGEQTENDFSLVVRHGSQQGDLHSVSTDKLLWADALEFNFNKTFSVSDLARFRNFLQNGITFTVVGVKHSYVLEDPQLEEGQPGSISEKQTGKSASKDRIKDIKEKKETDKESDSVADYPKIEFKYHVEFEFLKDFTREEALEETRGGEQTENDFSLVVRHGSQQGDLHSVSTDKLLWADALEFNFNKTFSVSDLARFRNFLQNGITFTVVGVKHSYVLEDPQLEEGQPGSISEKQTGKSASKDRIKDIKEKKETDKSAKGGKEKSKKDKHDLSELFELPQVRKIVGSCDVPLASLLEGEATVKLCCPCTEESDTNDESCPEDNPCGGSTKSQSAKRSDASEKKKTKGESDKHLKTTPTKGRAKDRKKSATTGAKTTKGGKGKEKTEEINDEEDEVAAPTPPLSIDLEIKLEQWKNTKDALQDLKN